MRMRAQHALADREAQLRAETRFRAITESAHDAIVSTDSAGVIVGWNGGAEVAFGYGEKDALGTPFQQLLVIADRAAYEAHLVQLDKMTEPSIAQKTIEVR